MAEKTKRVIFKVFAPDAQKGVLAGSFNKWSQDGDTLQRP